jgi:hypothetical protein
MQNSVDSNTDTYNGINVDHVRNVNSNHSVVTDIKVKTLKYSQAFSVFSIYAA